MGNISPTEILLVAGVIILLFGAKKLPEIARSLGKAKGEFKQGLQDGEPAPPADKPAEPAD